MKRKLIIFILLLAAALYFFHPAILQAAANYLVIEDKLEKSDIIIVLAGDNNGERVEEGVNLYKKGYAPYLLMSGGPLAWRLTYAQWMKKQAQYLGVPDKFILLQDKSLSTLQDAKFSLEIIKKKRFESAIVVSSPYHMRRITKVFRKIYPPAGIRTIFYPVQKSQWSRIRWWTRHEDIGSVVWEYVSLPFYFLRGY